MVAIADGLKHERSQEEIGRINNSFNRMVVEILGEGADQDQAPLRDRLADVPGGLIVVPDPGDLEPVRYVQRTPEEERDLPTFVLRAVKAVRARRIDSEG